MNRSTTLTPCSANEVAISPGDCVENGVEEWLEDEALPGFRVWQLAGIVLSVILVIIIGMCCCVRFRVPRTKQEIEADYIRKKIANSFRKKLSKIGDSEMDEMDLLKAMERIRNELEEDKCEIVGEERDDTYRHKQLGFWARIGFVFVKQQDGYFNREPTSLIV